MGVTTSQIKKLRGQTSAGVMDCKRALEEAGGDFKKAKGILRRKGALKAGKKAEREMSEGLVFSYIHNGGKIGALVKLSCETDFVARTDEFKHLGREIAMQVAAMEPSSVANLLRQIYIRDPGWTVKDFITEAIAKLGENIKVASFARFEV